MEIVSLHKTQTHVSCPDEVKTSAIHSALRMTMSPHEWVWTQEEQQAMAMFVLWSSQRLAAISQLVEGEVNHG